MIRMWNITDKEDNEMAELQLQNVRKGGDITFRVGLTDNGVSVDWSGLEEKRAFLMADQQKQISGEMSVRVDEDDPTVLVCTYSGDDRMYLGVNSVVVRAKYMGRLKVYDKKAVNIVGRTSAATGVVILEDPVVPVQLVVEEVDTTILNNAIDAAIAAAERAEDAADAAEHMVDIHRGPQGYSAYEIAVQEGYEGTVTDWLASLVGPQGKSAYEVAVEEGFVGTEEEWLLSLVGPQGLSAYQVAVEEGFEGTVTEWLDSLVGPTGATPNLTIGTVETGAAGSTAEATITGTPENPVLNLRIPQGAPGVVQAKYVHVDTLPTASEDTMDALYLVPTQVSNCYDVYYTTLSGRTTYSWVLLCNTMIQLSDYATKAEVDQLDLIVSNISGRFYGVFDDDSELPEGTGVGYAFVGTAEPLALFTFDGNDWTDTGIAISGIIGPPGPEGEKGDQGIPGVPGVSSVNATIDTGTGVPSVDVTFNAGVLTLAFHNMKGVQGDTGSSVSYPYTLVNNLTTDDATKGLAAAMGKMLNDLISALDASTNGGGVSLTPIATSDEYSQLNKDTGEIFVSSSPTGVVRDFAIVGGESLKVSGRIGTNVDCCLGAFFDAYGAFISSFCPATGTGTPYLDYEITSPNNAVMVRVAGNTHPDAPYAPGVIGWTDGIKQDLERVEKEVDGELAVISPDYVYEGLSQLDKNTGSVIASTATNGAVCEFSILGGGTIKVSGRVGTNAQCCLGAFFDENGYFISSFFPSNGTATQFLNQEVPVPSNAVMVRVAGNTDEALPYSPSVSAKTGGMVEYLKVIKKRDEFVSAFDIVSIPHATLPMFVSSTNLQWTNSANVKECYGIYKVQKGQRIQLVANSTNNSRYCFLTEYENAVAGQVASLLPSHPRTIGVNTRTTVLIIVPADCYLGVILQGSELPGGNFEPEHIYIEGRNFFKGLKSVWQGPSVMQGVGCQFQYNRFSDRVAQFLGMACVNYAITGSTVGKKPGSYESAFVSLSDWNDAVSGGLVDTSKTYLVKDNGDAAFPWAIYSYSGGTWSPGARTPDGAKRTPIADRISEMDTDADVIIVQGGTNDFQYDWDELGENGDTAITTVKGATRAICEFLINTYPKKLIVWLTSLTPFRYQGTHTTPYSQNALGYSGWDSHDAEMEVCEEYGIPVIDLGAEIGLSPANPWWDDYDSAGTRVHPNDEGHRIAASCLAKKLLAMMESL